MKQKSTLQLLLLCLCLNGMAQRKKVGLVLGGGGAKGAAHVGVLKVLEETGILGLVCLARNGIGPSIIFHRMKYIFDLGDKVFLPGC